MSFSKYTAKNVEQVFADFETSPSGLSKKEVVLRQKKYGLNDIKIKRTTAFQIFFRQIKSPFTYLLFFAALIAFFIGETIDFITIAAVVVINIIIGFFQEYRAERALQSLQK